MNIVDKVRDEIQRRSSLVSLQDVSKFVEKASSTISKDLKEGKILLDPPPLREKNMLLFTEEQVVKIAEYYESKPARKPYTKKDVVIKRSGEEYALQGLVQEQIKTRAVMNSISTSLKAIALSLHCLTLTNEAQVSEPARREYLDKLSKTALITLEEETIV